MKKQTLYNFYAILVVAIWGVTFISTKVLLQDMTPAGIMLCRFIIAYFGLLIMHPKFYPIKSIKEELAFMLGGLCGGSFYFFTENTAVKLTLTSNVSLILATVPILTALLLRVADPSRRLSRNVFYGFGVAILGVALVIFNGNFVLKLSPLGDLLALTAAASWAAYTLVLGKLRGRYHTLYTTRKIFLYALLTMLPIVAARGLGFQPAVLMQGRVLFNLLFLGLVASSFCYALWNLVVDNLGAVKANNYIYLIPLVTMAASALMLKEPVTALSLLGGALTILGVYLAENGPEKLWKLLGQAASRSQRGQDQVEAGSGQ